MTITAPAPTTGARAPLTHAERKAWNREFARLARLAGTVPGHNLECTDDHGDDACSYDCACDGRSYYAHFTKPEEWAFWTAEARDLGETPLTALLRGVWCLLDCCGRELDLVSSEWDRIEELAEAHA